MNKFDIQILFSKIKDKRADGTMTINGLDSIPIQSGPWGSGYCDLGKYTTGKLWTPEEIKALPNGCAYTKYGFGFFLLLKPLFKTNRTGIGIHPMRGNGTLGCCGVVLKDATAYQELYSKLSRLITIANKHTLSVYIGTDNS